MVFTCLRAEKEPANGVQLPLTFDETNRNDVLVVIELRNLIDPVRLAV